MLFRKSNEDEQRFTQLTARRRKMIDQAPSDKVVAEYGVNKLAKSLHPGMVNGQIAQIISHSADCKTIVLRSCAENGRFPYFRAGQYVTLTTHIGNSRVTRAYSLSSSPLQALQGRYDVTVKRAGLLSSWLLDEAKIGDNLLVGEPSGDFHHDSVRDKNTVVAIAGGSGITPFLSMIKAICEGSEDFHLILFYGAKNQQELLVTPNEITDERIKIVVVLSEEEVVGYEHGFVTAQLVSKYAPTDASFLMCGPDAMYHFVEEQLKQLGVPASRIRKEHNSIGQRKVENPKTFQIKVHVCDQVFEIPALENETLLVAMERAGLAVPSRCRSGICGYCHSKLLCGNYTVPAQFEYRRQADFKFGFIHPCCTYPDSDMEIDVPPQN